MGQPPASQASDPAFKIHGLTTTLARHADQGEPSCIEIELEFSLDPIKLDSTNPGEAEYARRLLENLTEELISITAITSREQYDQYRNGLRSNLTGHDIPGEALEEYGLTREEVTAPGFNQVLFWAAPGHPRFKDVHADAYTLNPTVQATELHVDGTRTTFHWAGHFKNNHATQGLLKQLQHAMSEPASTHDDTYRLQELTKLLQALSYFAD